jgi:hypothetical protein
MKKKFILYLILFIFLFNYKFEFFTDIKKENVYNEYSEKQVAEMAKITIGSCWANTTNTSFENINEKSPKWLFNIKNQRDKIINAKRCNRFKKRWIVLLKNEQEKSRSKFDDYLNKYTCSTRDNVFKKIQVKYQEGEDDFYGGSKKRKQNRINKINSAIDLIKDIKFLRKSNNKMAIELRKILKSGAFKNNNIKENCTILPGQDVNDDNNLFQ